MHYFPLFNHHNVTILYFLNITGSTNANANNAEAGMRCLVVGAPRVGGAKWAAAHAQLKEAELVADMLRVTPLTDYQVT